MSKVALIALTAFNSHGALDDNLLNSNPEGAFYKNDLVVELVVPCSVSLNEKPAYAIVSFSRIEKLYCAPNADCFRTARQAINKACS